MRKYMALILATAVSSCLLTGCNSITTGGAETIKVWTANSHSFGKELNFISHYNKTEGKEKGIYIDYVLKAYNLYEELEKAVASNNEPAFSSWVNLEAQIENGTIIAVNDLPGGDELVADHRDKGLEFSPYTEYEGKTYALPVGITTQGLIYNKNMFRNAGLVDENGEAMPPETLADMREYAKKLTNKNWGEYGIIFPMAWDTVKAYKGETSYDSWFNQDLFSMAIASMGKEEYEKTIGQSKIFVPYMQVVLDMRDDGSIYPGAEDMTNETARAVFSSGGVGMKISSSFDVAVFNYQFPLGDDWGVAPIPVLNRNERHKQVGSYNCTPMISESALHTITPEKLTEVFKLFVSDDYKAMLYKEGLQIPYGLDVSNVPMDNMPTGWAEFTKLAEHSELVPSGLMATGEGFPQIFVEDVYLGNENLEKASAEFDEKIVEAWSEMENN